MPICNLRSDYIFDQKPYLILEREEGILNSELSEIQVKMIQSNTIPRLVPIDIEERDSIVRFRYQLGSKRQLANVLKGQNLSMYEFVQLLLSITNTLSDSQNYMLNQEQFTIHEEYIYIGRDYSDIYLIYVPLQSLQKKMPLKEELQELFLKLIGSVEELKGFQLKEIIQYFNDQTFTLSGLKQKLSLLLNEKGDFTPDFKTINHQKENLIRHSQAYSDSQKNNLITFNKITQKENIGDSQNEVAAAVDLTPSKQTLNPLSSRIKIYLFLSAFLVIAIIWRFYLSYQNDSVFYVCIGLTIIVLNAVFIIVKAWKPGTSKINKNKHYLISKKDIEPPLHTEKATVNTKKSFISSDVSDSPLSQPREKESIHYYKNLQENTTLLTSGDQTVLLTDPSEQNGNQDNQQTALLEINFEGKIEKIPIMTRSFIIGRNPDMANYVENHIGVSRAHVEITNINNEYKIKDLGSRNGTLINQVRLIPNKEYLLQEGDIIKIAINEYVFKMD